MFDDDMLLENEAQRAAAAKPMSYSVTQNPPPDNPDVRIIFDGLLWFLFHGSDECQVGIHNSTQGRPHPHTHELNVNLWTITGCNTAQSQCTIDQHPIGNPKNITGISIDVNKPNPNYAGVHVYQKDNNPFNRNDPNNDLMDWRWVLDFEKEPFYPAGIKLDGAKINPSVSINHGTFYTLLLTTSKFGLLRPNGSLFTELGRVPRYVAANIYLDD